MALGRHVGVLVQTVVGFLEVPASGQQAAAVNSETEKQLGAFLEYAATDLYKLHGCLTFVSLFSALKSVESSVRQLQRQSDLEQGVSYKSNKSDLQSWDTEIKRAFDQLQVKPASA